MKNFNILLILLMGLTWTNTSYAIDLPGAVVDTNWLAKNKSNVVILSLLKDIKSFSKKPKFKKDKKSGELKLVKVGGHIPDSRLVNYKKIRGNRIINGTKYKKMIVDKSTFEKILQDAGVNKNSTIVIVSKGESNKDLTMATRLYWQMKYYGHDKMAVLNGGMAQWIVEKRNISIKPTTPKKGNWLASTERKNILATSKEVEVAIKNKTQLVDTRSLGLYLGTWRKNSYVYANGHIPGAKPFPNELLSTKMPAKFLTVADSKKLFNQMGINPEKNSITYCNSGHLATGSWFVMAELMGNKKVKMYDGSMHKWTVEKRKVVKMKME